MPGVLTITICIDPVLPGFTIIGRTGRTRTQHSAGEDQQENGQQDSHHWIHHHEDAGIKVGRSLGLHQHYLDNIGGYGGVSVFCVGDTI